ncbi:hypothetical protein SAMN03159341_101690 [Paenibacillus sp. 1_12]|uniref:S-Ena type endospore appendage n=1 Tax=Paenibacillus sp. 1_12 TaxID=1566278 RepID=UPI0008F21276|nr:S-Ena type endospore appendage [Paenibacillus sp. 1_12]SFK81345.1 hypothetical protein SAMN03159341_101690 [Paenibacillus sp. 1_12]
MSCSSSTSNCCQQPIVSVCLAQQDYHLAGSAAVSASTLFGPNPAPVAASGLVSNTSTNSAAITFTFRRGATIVATLAAVASGQTRSFVVPGFTSISATATLGSAVAELCMTEFFRTAV